MSVVATMIQRVSTLGTKEGAPPVPDRRDSAIQRRSLTREVILSTIAAAPLRFFILATSSSLFEALAAAEILAFLICGSSSVPTLASFHVWQPTGLSTVYKFILTFSLLSAYNKTRRRHLHHTPSARAQAHFLFLYHRSCFSRTHSLPR